MELTPFFFGLYKFVKYGLYPLTWVVVLLSAAGLLALLPFSPKRLRWVRLLIISSLLLLLTLSSPLIATPLIGSLEAWHQPPQLTPSDRFDAIVVLGGGVDEKGSIRPTTGPSSDSRNRTTCGVDLYQRAMPLRWCCREETPSLRHGPPRSDRNETMGSSPRRSRVRHDDRYRSPKHL